MYQSTVSRPVLTGGPRPILPMCVSSEGNFRVCLCVKSQCTLLNQPYQTGSLVYSIYYNPSRVSNAQTGKTVYEG